MSNTTTTAPTPTPTLTPTPARPGFNKIPRAPSGTATAPLLYWLLVVCGLVGLTIVQLDSSAIADSDIRDLVPVWIGSILGVGLGQLLSWLRVRAWLPIVIMLGMFWVLPVVYFVLYDGFGSGISTFALAFFPAAICGYLSLTERGALVSFWYPAVLWMLVILDGGEAPGSFNARAALPFAIGLAGLFVAFLRARETRRVAIWQAHGSVRIAAPLSRTVLRASPIRAISQLAWTSLVGAGALVLASWIAPHLWQKEKAKHAKPTSVISTIAPAAAGVAAAPISEEPCCPENGMDDAQRKRVREYFPLPASEAERERQRLMLTCVACRNGKRITSTSTLSSGDEVSYGGSSFNGPYGSNGYGGSAPVAPSDGTGTDAYTAGGNDNVGPYKTYALPLPSQIKPPQPAPLDPNSILKPTTTTAVAKKPAPPAPPPPTTVKPPQAPPTTPVEVTPPTPTPVTASVTITPVHTAPRDTGSPWKWTFALCMGGLGLHILVRMARRQLTLRHLARPFWRETLDQRISNHWQRMLIGLRDAGIHPVRDEQPQAFAKRVDAELGNSGAKSANGPSVMKTCATILERVRHGVRVDASDLDTMDAAATNMYRTARTRAGVSGRLTSWLRWPLV